MTQKNIWMHIGAGAFHRAHQAVYIDKLRKIGDISWGISLGNIRNDATELLNILQQQNGAYTLETITPDGDYNYETISSVTKVLTWDKDLSSLVEEATKLDTKIISFTVTEGGYYLDNNHKLDETNIDIQKDLAGETNTLYGTLAKMLSNRMIVNPIAKLTLLSCDNVRHNGDLFRRGFLDFLKLKGSTELSKWVESNTTSPNTMVDRITPRSTADVVARVKKATGVGDNAALMSESFIQWVIEDKFINGRPELERVGVDIVTDVAPWEEAKIRILNATHSCVAWAGTLTGYTYIDDSVRVEAIKKLAYNYITNDVIPALTPSPLDLYKYRDIILSRFSNPYIKDTNQRVTADSLSKVPGFIIPTLIDTYSRGAVPKSTTILPALYFVFLEKWHLNQLPYEYQDGLLNTSEMHSLFDSNNPLLEFCKDRALFGELVNKQDFYELMLESIAYLKEWVIKNSK